MQHKPGKFKSVKFKWWICSAQIFFFFVKKTTTDKFKSGKFKRSLLPHTLFATDKLKFLPPFFFFILIDDRFLFFPHEDPRWLTFSWWESYGLCRRHKPTELAHSFLFCSCVCFCLYGPFRCMSFHKFSRQSPFSHSVLLVLPPSYWSFQLYIALWKSPSALI